MTPERYRRRAAARMNAQPRITGLRRLILRSSQYHGDMAAFMTQEHLSLNRPPVVRLSLWERSNNSFNPLDERERLALRLLAMEHNHPDDEL
jgi:hypothetical protein